MFRMLYGSFSLVRSFRMGTYLPHSVSGVSVAWVLWVVIRFLGSWCQVFFRTRSIASRCCCFLCECSLMVSLPSLISDAENV